MNARGDTVLITGEPFAQDLAEQVLQQLYKLHQHGLPTFPQDVDRAIQILSDDRSLDLADIFLDRIHVTDSSRVIVPKGVSQKRYVDAIRQNDIVFGIGPAGTGKTYLAMAMAMAGLNSKRVQRTILTRPAVEAGEKLGFLPGDILEKVNPYLRPLYDALHDMMDFEKARRMVDRGVIEVAPLAFMRGRTLNDSFVILDEAQNTTIEQMKMFLTRLGYESQAIITGDITQIDLPDANRCGLVHAAKVLQGIEGIKFCYFTEKDVVRHPLVSEIIKAYERDTQQSSNNP